MFVVQEENEINIGDVVKLELAEFRTLEPNMMPLPNGYSRRVYYPNKSHEIYGNDRITIKGPVVWEEGDRYIKRLEEFKRLRAEIEAENQSVIANVEAELKKRKPYHENRRAEYPKIEELVEALWENLVEGRTEKAEAIQKLRQEIKKKYPKKVK